MGTSVKITTALLFTIGLSACSLPTLKSNEVIRTYYNNSTRYTMPPAAISEENQSFGKYLADFQLGAYYVKEEKHEQLYFIVAIAEEEDIESLGIAIDGNHYGYITNQATSKKRHVYPGLNGIFYMTSVKKFNVPSDILEDMINGQEVIITVKTSRREMKGDFKYDCHLGTLYKKHVCQAMKAFYDNHIKKSTQ